MKLASKAAAQPPDVSFSTEDCEVFARYPNSVCWNDVSQSHQQHFKNVWAKLKELSKQLAATPNAAITLKAET